jgi:CheY-like chemotaxis protein
MRQLSNNPAPAGLLLCDDLIFTSRITGIARSLGLEVRQARSPEVLLELARQASPRGVLIDLGYSGLALEDLMARLAQACPTMPRVIAYGSHVDTASLKAARAAGCDPVLPRSKFVEDLATELPNWLASR